MKRWNSALFGWESVKLCHLVAARTHNWHFCSSLCFFFVPFLLFFETLKCPPFSLSPPPFKLCTSFGLSGLRIHARAHTKRWRCESWGGPAECAGTPKADQRRRKCCWFDSWFLTHLTQRSRENAELCVSYGWMTLSIESAAVCCSDMHFRDRLHLDANLHFQSGNRKLNPLSASLWPSASAHLSSCTSWASEDYQL